MRGRDHTINTLSDLTADPWIFFLALLIGLVVLFFFCAARVQADMPSTATFGATTKEIEILPVPKSTENHVKAKGWTVDFSDISNERTKPADSQNPQRLKGPVGGEGRRSLLDNIPGFFKSIFVGSPNNSSQK